MGHQDWNETLALCSAMNETRFFGAKWYGGLKLIFSFL